MSIFTNVPKIKPLRAAIHSSVERCGAVFVSLDGIGHNLNNSLPIVLNTVRAENAWFIGMMSGVLQIMVRDKTEQNIEEKTKSFVEIISSSVHDTRAVVVWTVQHCVLGCWGDDINISYGVLIPNYREILRALASAEPGRDH